MLEKIESSQISAVLFLNLHVSEAFQMNEILCLYFKLRIFSFALCSPNLIRELLSTLLDPLCWIVTLALHL